MSSKFNNIPKQIPFLLFMFFSSFVFSETFRVHSVIPAVLADKFSSVSVNVGINDVLYIELPQETSFIVGLELEVKIPKEIASWRDSVAYFLYTNVTPNPTTEIIDYSGDKLSINTFPGRLSHNIRIPFAGKDKIKESPYYTVLPEIDEDRNNGVFLRMQLAMKGTSDAMDKSQLTITVKPILAEEGSLLLETIFPQDQEVIPTGRPYIVYIDESPVAEDVNLEEGIILPVGLHHLSIVSEYFRNEVRSFSIEQAQVSKLEIELHDIAPTVQISAPENVIVYLDGDNFVMSPEPVKVESGEHFVRFVFGDYEIIKTFQAVNGRSYDVSLGVDVKVVEK